MIRSSLAGSRFASERLRPPFPHLDLPRAAFMICRPLEQFMIKNDIISLIKDKGARVGVIGLGYVGLPLATEFAGAEIATTGFEVDEKKVTEINAGRSYIGDVASESIKQAVDANRLRATTDFPRLQDCAAIIICE